MLPKRYYKTQCTLTLHPISNSKGMEELKILEEDHN